MCLQVHGLAISLCLLNTVYLKENSFLYSLLFQWTNYNFLNDPPTLGIIGVEMEEEREKMMTDGGRMKIFFTWRPSLRLLICRKLFGEDASSQEESRFILRKSQAWKTNPTWIRDYSHILRNSSTNIHSQGSLNKGIEH